MYPPTCRIDSAVAVASVSAAVPDGAVATAVESEPDTGGTTATTTCAAAGVGGSARISGVGIGVCVGAGMLVGARVAVLVGSIGVAVGSVVCVTAGVLVSDKVCANTTGASVGICVTVGVGVKVGMAVGVAVAVDVVVGANVLVGMGVRVAVLLRLDRSSAELRWAAVGTSVGVCVTVDVGMSVAVAVGVCVTVDVGTGVCVAVGGASLSVMDKLSLFALSVGLTLRASRTMVSVPSLMPSSIISTTIAPCNLSSSMVVVVVESMKSMPYAAEPPKESMTLVPPAGALPSSLAVTRTLLPST